MMFFYKVRRVSFAKYVIAGLIGWIIACMLFGLHTLSPLDSLDRVLQSTLNNIGDDMISHRSETNKAAAYQATMNSAHERIEGKRDEDNMYHGEQGRQIRPPVASNRSAGDMGTPVKIDPNSLSVEEKRKYDMGWKNHAFNEYVSKMISLHRKLADFRDMECKTLIYPDNLPTASVIVIFHNEAWSVLLRTVHSVLENSPSHLVHEIILVDDHSYYEHLKTELDDYISKLDKVKLVRAKRREGLIRARMMGSDIAKGDVLIFLDSHCEASPGWLEPLLHMIWMNPKASAVPLIETISDDTFAVHGTNIDDIQVGGFTWQLIFNWIIPEKEVMKQRAKRTDGVKSPSMAGGLFAIGREWFEKLGKYDPGMDIWGGENIELSLKLWMCGGELMTMPCSHVAHLFRQRSPYQWPVKDVIVKNTMRVAMVWLDDYKKFYLDATGKKPHPDLYGDIKKRIELRQKLKCTNFSYYREHVYPTLFLPTEAQIIKEIKNKATGLCLDSAGKSKADSVIAYPCHGKAGPQQWYYTKQKEIRKEQFCLDYSEGSNLVTLYECHHMKGNQEWTLRNDSAIFHDSSDRCLSNDSKEKLVMKVCNPDDQSQKWDWSLKVLT